MYSSRFPEKVLLQDAVEKRQINGQQQSFTSSQIKINISPQITLNTIAHVTYAMQPLQTSTVMKRT